MESTLNENLANRAPKSFLPNQERQKHLCRDFEVSAPPRPQLAIFLTVLATIRGRPPADRAPTTLRVGFWRQLQSQANVPAPVVDFRRRAVIGWKTGAHPSRDVTQPKGPLFCARRLGPHTDNPDKT